MIRFLCISWLLDTLDGWSTAALDFWSRSNAILIHLPWSNSVVSSFHQQLATWQSSLTLANTLYDWDIYHLQHFKLLKGIGKFSPFVLDRAMPGALEAWKEECGWTWLLYWLWFWSKVWTWTCLVLLCRLVFCQLEVSQLTVPGTTSGKIQEHVPPAFQDVLCPEPATDWRC